MGTWLGERLTTHSLVCEQHTHLSLVHASMHVIGTSASLFLRKLTNSRFVHAAASGGMAVIMLSGTERGNGVRATNTVRGEVTVEWWPRTVSREAHEVGEAAYGGRQLARQKVVAQVE